MKTNQFKPLVETREGLEAPEHVNLIIAENAVSVVMLNPKQSDAGLVLLAMPKNPRPFIEWAEQEQGAFLKQSESLFREILASLNNSSFGKKISLELLLNPGDHRERTPNPTSLYCIVGYKSPLLTWERNEVLTEVSLAEFREKFLTKQGCFLYKDAMSDEHEIPWNLLIQPEANMEFCSLPIHDAYCVIREDGMEPQWESKSNALRHALKYSRV